MVVMRVVPAVLLLVPPALVLGALVLVGRPAEVSAPTPPQVRMESVELPAAPTAAPAAKDLDARVAETLRAWPDRAVVTCPLEGRLRFAVMPLHVHLGTPGDPAPSDYAVVQDHLVLAVPPGSGAVNLSTGDGAGLGRLGWGEVGPGEATVCTGFRWTQGPLVVPGLVRGKVPDGAVVRACGEAGRLTPVQKNGSFSLSLERSAAICTVRLEIGARAGRWQEVRADRLDGTIWLDLPT